LFDEEKKHRRSVCACCDELCKKVHDSILMKNGWGA
jgi:hypothetical protein